MNPPEDTAGGYPTLTEFNISPAGWLILHLEADGRKVLRKIDLHRDGAGLWAVCHRRPVVTFRRGSHEEFDARSNLTREWSVGTVTVQCGHVMSFLLRHVLWGEHWAGMA